MSLALSGDLPIRQLTYLAKDVVKERIQRWQREDTEVAAR